MTSAFKKGIILFLVLIICVYSLGLVLFQFSGNAIVEVYYNSLINQVKIYFTSLENEIDRIGTMQDQLLLDDDLTALSFKKMNDFDFDMTKSIKKIIGQMNMIKNISSNIESVSVSIPSLNRKYQCGDGPSYYEYFYDPGEISSGGTRQRIVFDTNGINICAPLYISRQSNPVFIEAKLSNDRILTSIKEFNITEKARSYLIFKQMDAILTTESPEDAEIVRDMLTGRDSIRTVDLFGEKQFVISYYSDYLEASYIQVVPEALIIQNINSFKPLYYIFSGFVLLTVGIYIIYTYRNIKKPIDNEMYQQRTLYQRAELRQLQAQINPHFLYNSFFILKKRIVKGQSEEAARFCDMLGMYFHYITQNYTDYATLGEEVNHSRLYAEIQAIRFSDRITVSIDELPEIYSGIAVPKLILQPVLENAFKYGLENLAFDGILRVRFHSDEHYVYIRVEDNGVPMDEERLKGLNDIFANGEIQKISGLLNIHKRMQFFSRDPTTGLSFEKSEMGGLCVVLKVRKEALHD